MIVFSAAFAHRLDIKTRPPLCELGAHRLEPLDQLDEMRLASMTSIIGADPGERVLGPLAPIDNQGAQRRIGEEEPKHVSFGCGHLLEIEKERARAPRSCR